MHFDVFNGDADGLLALHQLRLAEPREGVLVTGVKRDIGLLRRVAATAGDTVTVLDVAVEKNHAPLLDLLARGVRVQWFDHHHPGPIPAHPGLDAHIDTAGDTCTALLVDRQLEGRFRAWAVAAAFGDNLEASALRAAEPLALDETRLAELKVLGELLNYNAYGDTVEDLRFRPEAIFLGLRPYSNPFEFIRESLEFQVLLRGHAEDMEAAWAVAPLEARDGAAIYLLPDTHWARRISGTFANHLANARPERAHALLTRSAIGHFVVSVRAPVANRSGADTLCLRFATGGGRKGAAGINALPEARLEDFTAAFFDAYARSG